MKYRRFFFLAIVLSVSTVYAQQSWQASVRNPNWFGATSSSNGQVLIWGTDARVWYRSAGVWRDALTGQDRHVRGLKFLSPDLAIAYGDEGLLMVSYDAGKTWVANDAAAGRSINSIAASQTQVLVSGEQLLLISSLASIQNSQANWEELPLPTTAFTQIQSLSGQSWAAIDAQGKIWISQDHARSWQFLHLPAMAAGVQAIQFDGQDLLVILKDGGVQSWNPKSKEWRVLYRSPSGRILHQFAMESLATHSLHDVLAFGAQGSCAARIRVSQKWRNCSISGESRGIAQIARSSHDHQWVAVGSEGLSYSSTDQGQHWAVMRKPNQLPQHDKRALDALAWDSQRQGFVTAGTGGQIFFSPIVNRNAKQPAKWSIDNAGVPHYIHDLVDAPDGGLIAAMTHRSLARSTDGGLTWRSHEFESLSEVSYLYAMRRQGSSVIVAGSQGGAMFTPDGKLWQTLKFHERLAFQGIQLNQQKDWAILYGTDDVAARIHMQTGQVQMIKLPTTEALFRSAMHPSGRLYLLGEQGMMIHSGDDGQSWHASPVPEKKTLYAAKVTLDGSALLLAGKGDRLWRVGLDVKGTPQGFESIELPISSAWNFITSDQAGKYLWLLGDKGHFLRSGDHGKTWTTVQTGVDALLRLPTYDAKHQRWWMPGRNGTLMTSQDDGDTWQRVPTGTKEHFKGLWIHPENGNVLLYGARVVHISADTTTGR